MLKFDYLGIKFINERKKQGIKFDTFSYQIRIKPSVYQYF